MATNPPPPSTPSFHLGDIYYILFRHKWKILVCMFTGLVAGAIVYKTQKPPFQSVATLFIRFVISEGRSMEPGENDSVTLSTDARGANVMSAELQILKSRDIAEMVAKSIGPEKVLGIPAAEASLNQAASAIQAGTTAELQSRLGSVINLSYKHKDVEMAQTILREIISSYLKRHVEIHRAAGMVGNFLAQETDQLRARLSQTEEELRKANNKAGVVSLEVSKQAFSDQMIKIRSEIFAAEAELASHVAVYEKMSQLQQPAAPKPAANVEETPEATPSRKQIESFQLLSRNITTLRRTEQELLKVFQEGSGRVQDVRKQLETAETEYNQLIAQFPSLARTAKAATTTSSTPTEGFDLIGESAKITSLETRIKTLKLQLEQVLASSANLDQVEIAILDLRRRKELEEENYRRYAASFEHSRIKEAMGDGKVSNISVVQAPTPAFQDRLPLKKLSAGIAAGGLVLGLIWAALIEFVIDRSIRRPAEVENLLHVPLFISVPRLKTLARSRRKTALPLPPTSGPTDHPPPQTSSPTANGSLATPQDLDPFHQTLRDRLIGYFESINLRHKPKLIAVTGLGHGSGVTTTAAGLARSLSETGEGNVLLVDMTRGQGSAQHFQRGNQVGLDQLLDTRKSALVQENLYVVSEHSGDDRLAKGMPQRFSQLVPKLKASDFDYIIFDMPPVSQISITPRLASFMDMTLLVLESEKTDRFIARRAADLLAQSKTQVGVVLNKNQSYVPARLHQDHDFLMGF